jgi:SAM-dependent methyltransferase
MKHLNCYIGTGPIGPSKFWEYPWTLANLRLKKGFSILDVGCGTSPIQYLLSNLGLNVYAIDSNEDLKWHGINYKLAKLYRSKINYFLERADNLSFNDNTFDRVFCLSVIEHVRADKVLNYQLTPLTEKDLKTQRKIVEEMIRVLKPGGLCVITVDFYIPRENVLLESNVNIKNLINIEGAEMIGKRVNESFPGEDGFNYIDLIKNSDFNVINYYDLLQVAIGFTLRKLK